MNFLDYLNSHSDRFKFNGTYDSAEGILTVTREDRFTKKSTHAIAVVSSEDEMFRLRARFFSELAGKENYLLAMEMDRTSFGREIEWQKLLETQAKLGGRR